MAATLARIEKFRCNIPRHCFGGNYWVSIITNPVLIPFVKANACGNDFLIVEGEFAREEFGRLSKQMCDRHAGVGADGVEWLFPTSEADIQARLFNADGSEAEISGNGTRCVAAYLCSQDKTQNKKIAILTGAGVKSCELVARSGNQYDFDISMGAPLVGVECAVEVGTKQVCGVPVSVGNPHFVVFVNEFAEGWQTEAKEVGQDARFSHGTNVELVRIIDSSNVEVRFFERGVGETQSSGTGSCASAVAAISIRRATSPVVVRAPGGSQTVFWNEQVLLRGSAKLICRGEMFF
ncbi:MAG: diaminopimelate epimerase [Acidobacteriota bacterium]|nr:diaminopimelate epimerase [Acidobacteriota bacterium]